MVKGKLLKTEEVEYRKIDALNQSAIVTFDSDPIKFYKEVILKEEKEDTNTSATLIGDLADFYLLECRGNMDVADQNFDTKFAKFDGIKSSAQVFTLADELFSIAKRTAIDGIVQGDFEEMFKEAFYSVQGKEKYKGKTWEKGLEDFNKNGKDYYDTLKRNVGKKTVDNIMIETGKRISNQLLIDDNTREIFHGRKDKEWITKFPIEFKWKGFDCKMEADGIEIDHKKKEIQPIDLKATYDNEEFEYSFLKRSYYIQAGFYYIGIELWAEEEGMKDYIVSPMKFLVGDTSKNKRRPLIYKTTREMLHESLHGFTYNKRKYRGIIELMDEIAWHQENAIWNISRTNYENKGIVEMKSFSDGHK